MVAREKDAKRALGIELDDEGNCLTVNEALEALSTHEAPTPRFDLVAAERLDAGDGLHPVLEPAKGRSPGEDENIRSPASHQHPRQHGEGDAHSAFPRYPREIGAASGPPGVTVLMMTPVEPLCHGKEPRRTTS